MSHGERSDENFYFSTAGEIEARDVSQRMDYTAEQRKSTRPDIDRTDVVFAEDGVSYEVKLDGDGNKYWNINSGKDIFKGLSTPEEYRDAAYKYLISNRDNEVTVKDSSGREIKFIRLSAEEFTYSEESKALFEENPTMYNQKMRLIPSLQDILLNANVNWSSPDFKNHKLFKEKGFENYRGKVRIDNVIFNSIVRIGKAKFGDVFYDINLEVDQYLPHTDKDASDIKGSTSKISIPNSTENVKQNSKKSLSSPNTTPKKHGDYAVYGEDVMLEGEAKPTGRRKFTSPTRTHFSIT